MPEKEKPCEKVFAVLRDILDELDKLIISLDITIDDLKDYKKTIKEQHKEILRLAKKLGR